MEFLTWRGLESEGNREENMTHAENERPRPRLRARVSEMIC